MNTPTNKMLTDFYISKIKMLTDDVFRLSKTTVLQEDEIVKLKKEIAELKKEIKT